MWELVITLYAKFSIATTDAPKLTTSDGYCFSLDNNNKIRDAAEGALNTRYGTATVSFVGWYNDAAGLSAASNADIYQIVSGSLSLDVSGGSRTRMSKTAPANDTIGVADDDSFDEVFSALGGKVSLSVTITEDGEHDGAPTVTIEQSGAVYFSVAGESPDQTKAQMEAKIGNTASPDNIGTFTQTLTVAKHTS